jgi:hypothetical protein
VNRWWRRGVSLIVLFVLAGAPAVAAACADLCRPHTNGSASTHHAPAAGHHGQALADCHESASVILATSARPGHPCDNHEFPGIDSAWLTAGRADADILSAAQASALPPTTAPARAALAAIRGPSTPLAPPHRPAAPLVLRI